MKAGHSHIQKNGRGRGRRDLVQGIFTQTKSITDHDHIQMIQGIFTHTKSITDHNQVQLIQGIFTQTKSITDHEHHLTFRSQRQSQSHALRILFIRYCADKTSPKITILIASMFTEKLLQTFRHFPRKTM